MACNYIYEPKRFVLTDLSEKVQRSQLDPMTLNRVNLTSLRSTDHIFVQKIDDEYETNLTNVDALDLRYASLVKPKCLPKPILPNTMCVVKLCGRFYRALTVEVGDNASSVLFADFGGVRVYNNYELYLPMQEFIEFPIMGIECIIDFVSIAYEDGPFVRVPGYSSYHLVCGDHYAKVLYEDHEGLPHIELCIKYAS